MKHKGQSLQELQEKYGDWASPDRIKYWRAWGSWFGWGSPVGLGLFFIAICFCVWLLGQTFGWK